MAVTGASASWFTSEPQYSTWSAPQLKAWLVAHDVPLPEATDSAEELRDAVRAQWDAATAWSQDQYHTAQGSFTGVKSDAFNLWDESTLRQWLLEQGIVAPNSKKEELVLIAQQRYNSYQNAASRWSDWALSSASSVASEASSLANSAYGEASSTGSSAAGHVTSSVASVASDASATASGYAAEATREAQYAFDNTKDYVYSTWDDNQLRDYLVEKGVIKSDSQKTRDELLQLMSDAYAKVADPTWEAWSTSYMHKWLAQKNLLPESQLTWNDKYESKRDEYASLLKSYYYDTNTNVWDTWTDSQLHDWLVDHKVIKSRAQLSRDKMLGMVAERYDHLSETLVSAWTTSEIRNWLVDHQYIDDRTAAGKKRDELITLASQHYKELAATAKQQSLDAKSKVASYLTWPDTRLRAYLRENGLSEKKIPTQRDELLRKVRDVYEHGSWVTKEENEGLLARVRETARFAEAKVEKAWEVVKDKIEL